VKSKEGVKKKGKAGGNSSQATLPRVIKDVKICGKEKGGRWQSAGTKQRSDCYEKFSAKREEGPAEFAMVFCKKGKKGKKEGGKV